MMWNARNIIEICSDCFVMVAFLHFTTSESKIENGRLHELDSQFPKINVVTSTVLSHSTNHTAHIIRIRRDMLGTSCYRLLLLLFLPTVVHQLNQQTGLPFNSFLKSGPQIGTITTKYINTAIPTNRQNPIVRYGWLSNHPETAPVPLLRWEYLICPMAQI